jgi:hypothetical protein
MIQQISFPFDPQLSDNGILKAVIIVIVLLLALYILSNIFENEPTITNRRNDIY